MQDLSHTRDDVPNCTNRHESLRFMSFATLGHISLLSLDSLIGKIFRATDSLLSLDSSVQRLQRAELEKKKLQLL